MLFFTIYITILIYLTFVILNDRATTLINNFKQEREIVFVLISVLISTVYSKCIFYSFCADFVLLLNILAYLLLKYNIFEGQKIEKYYILCIISICISSYGVYQIFSGNISINKHWGAYGTNGQVLLRVYSIFYNPNVLAGYLSTSICFSLAYYLYNKNSFINTVNLTISSLCIILTYSRGGFVALVFGCLLMFILKRDKRVIFYTLFICTVFLVVNSNYNSQRIAVSAVKHEGSYMYRLEIYKTATKIFLDNFITGNGIGTLWYYLSLESEHLWSYIYHAHNIFIHIIAETGILGFFAFINIISKKFYKHYTLFNKCKDDKYAFALLGFLASIFVIIIHGMIDAVVLVPSLSIFILSYFAYSERVLYDIVKSLSFSENDVLQSHLYKRAV